MSSCSSDQIFVEPRVDPPMSFDEAASGNGEARSNSYGNNEAETKIGMVYVVANVSTYAGIRTSTVEP